MATKNQTTPYNAIISTYDEYVYSSGAKDVNQNGKPSIRFIGNNIKNGSTLPGYKDLILRGSDATTSYTRKVYKVKLGTISMRTYDKINRINGYRRESNFFYVPDVSYTSSDVVNDASNRLKRKLREFTGQSNQLTNVAELREIPKTIGGLAKSGIGLVSTVLNSKRRGENLRKYASDLWLTWSFGISPTLGAIDDAVSSMNSYLERDDHTIKEYGIFSKDRKSGTRNETTGSLGSSIVVNSDYTHNLSCKITAGYRYTLLSSNNYTMAKHLGFDISNVVPTLWELLPYSWLIDYFTTAGSFIEDAFSAECGNSIYICQNIMLRVTGRETYTYRVFNPTNTQLKAFVSTPAEFEYFELTRTPLVSLPRAPLRFKTSNEIASNAVNKLLNLTAILGSKK